MRNIYVYIISLLACCILQPLAAQEKKQLADITRSLWVNGVTVQADVASLVTSLVTKGEAYSAEGGVQIDLKHKYYPIVELGFGGANKISAADVDFSTYGLYGRLGVDINLIKKSEDSKPSNNLFLAGVRLGMSNFRYNITNQTVTDPYWGGTRILDPIENFESKFWFEIVAGVRVEVVKNIYMGWNIRNKQLLSKDPEGQPSTWYIPGFGRNTGSAWGFNYIVGYHF